MAVLVQLLACMFGTGAWVAINGLWVELPLIVNELPEGWYLPSYLTVIIQMANVGPLFVTLMHRFQPGKLNEVAAIYTIVVIGIIACLLLAFLWRYTSLVGGVLHSTAFLSITLLLSLVDCTSSVTFLPFMTQLPSKYLTTYFVGEGLSGFIPGLLALAQGVGMHSCVNVSLTVNTTLGNATDEQHQILTEYLPANFSTNVFFLLLTAMMVLCLVAFFFLTRVSGSVGLSRDNLLAGSISLRSLNNVVHSTNGPKPSDGDESFSLERSENANLDGRPNTETDDPAKFSHAHLAFIYFMVAWVNSLTNGVLPSIQTYSCMPYGSMAYHLSATLGSMANPLACIIAMFLPSRSLPLLGALSLAGTGFGAYNMVTAVLSPCPFLNHSDWGVALIVLSWVLFSGLLSYVKVMTGVLLRSHSHSALVWCGAVVQLGSMIGALVMFPLINVYSFFQSADLCSVSCPV
ncbi:solute carrier family 52, riboflavin transporter, member 3 [Ambystoma mexicanum]|uniref:solute carrier family 52, riboflavin transporter, member 3 n=1 Tax=Ambystoma mexicanum TaxID=8296 RepID=UPI0037E810FF